MAKRPKNIPRNDGYVYCLHDTKNDICRIGKTHIYDLKRITHQIGYYPYELIDTKVYSGFIWDCEMYLHNMFKKYKLRGSWYKISPEDFWKHANEYAEVAKNNQLGRLEWVNNQEIKYKLKSWIIYINGIEHFVELVECDTYNVRCVFKMANKHFNVSFVSKGFYTARNGRVKQPITITNKSKTQRIDAYILFKTF